MPFRFVCHSCGALLHEDLPTPRQLNCSNFRRVKTYVERVVEKLGGECSFCGAKLQVPPLKVEVQPNPATKSLSPLVSAFKHDYHQRRCKNRLDRIKRRLPRYYRNM